ncbi:hypothetical protein OsJ_18248 [Oryza sativa Japonica Group]|uniref:Complex 1 LYR protein domain-containing protein n=1 Tax=Oryza sativa subsp. japonica TaxID=39947 RepID=B9FHG8_ORYSJ|nr:hypothetical protein OsJ_18248 [Oryza sativa Japonica Group]
MAAAAAAEGLAAYRAVLRAARRTFAGDRLMLAESAVEIRRRFEEHRGLAPGSGEAARALSDAREAAHFITHMIVQAQRAPSGSFGFRDIFHCVSILELHLPKLEIEVDARRRVGN